MLELQTLLGDPALRGPILHLTPAAETYHDTYSTKSAGIVQIFR